MVKRNISENLVSLVWQYQILIDLVTDTGEQVCVIYPGRPDSDGGCDFRDAVLIIAGREVRGDIEVHVNSTDWIDHGHHRDSRYNSIVLHVVMFHDLLYPAVLQNGQIIPTVNLGRFITEPLLLLAKDIHLSQLQFSCSNVKGYAREVLLSLLYSAGRKRFEGKAAAFSGLLIKGNPGQVLYSGIAKALGYAKNTTPFEKLANLLPLATIESLRVDDEITLRALIIGSAGLLLSQQVPVRSIHDSEANVLERSWENFNITNTLKRSEWNLFRVRPYNSPVRRMVALSNLIAKYKQSGLFNGMLKMLFQAPESNPYRWIYNNLVFPHEGYWGNHFDFGIAMSNKSAILGKSRASEMAINIIFPYMYAWACLNGKLSLKQKSLDLYLFHPRLENNQLTDHMMKQLLIDSRSRLSACQQQGLVHIFKSWCRARNCGQCIITLGRN
jgi:hypothetical protein